MDKVARYGSVRTKRIYEENTPIEFLPAGIGATAQLLPEPIATYSYEEVPVFSRKIDLAIGEELHVKPSNYSCRKCNTKLSPDRHLHCKRCEANYGKEYL